MIRDSVANSVANNGQKCNLDHRAYLGKLCMAVTIQICLVSYASNLSQTIIVTVVFINLQY